MKRIAIAQLKGGVGKSTLTLLLAEVWAVLRGRRVLVVDLDPQSSVTFMLISAKQLDLQQTARRTLPHFFQDSHDGRPQIAVSYIVPRVSDVTELHDTNLRGFVSLLPTTPNLWFHEYDFDRAKYAARSDPVAAREVVLRSLLDEVSPLYDVVLIDCPPGFSTLTRSALRVVDGVIAPTISEVTSARSLKDFIEQGLQGTLGWSALERLQIVVSKHGNTNHQSEVLDQLRGEYRGRIVPGFIPDRDQIRIATAILPGNDRRSYAQKYRRPMFNPVAVDIERVANRLYKRIFEASLDTEARDE